MKFNFSANSKSHNVFVLAFLLLLTRICSVNGCNRRKKPGSDSTPKDNTKLTCQDEAGRPLQWFMAYKLAKIRDSGVTHVRNGLGYAFLVNGTDQWQMSGRSIGDSNSIVGISMMPLYEMTTHTNSSNLLYILYNDQPPNKSSVGYNGHMKGILLANEFGGIWIQHSVPKFPELTVEETYSYPNNGENNAQMFFCMTLSSQNINDVIANTLLQTKPTVYNHSIPESLKHIYPNLGKLVAKGRKPTTLPSQMYTLIDGDLNLTIFAKGPKFEKEIYSDWIAPTLDSSLKVQSWLNGANSLSSNCQNKKYQILNISDKQLHKQKFSTSKDHSKWAISHEGKWTCISDLNRMDSQKSRGGAALCTMNENIWRSFENSILDVQPCERPVQQA